MPSFCILAIKVVRADPSRAPAPRASDNPVGCGKGPNDMLAFHIFERCPITLLSAPTALVSLRRWLQFVQRRTQDFARRKNHRPLDDVLQFTDIARPRVALTKLPSFQPEHQ